MLGGPLEKEAKYSGLTDFIKSIPLMRGSAAAAAQVGEFKVRSVNLTSRTRV